MPIRIGYNFFVSVKWDTDNAPGTTIITSESRGPKVKFEPLTCTSFYNSMPMFEAGEQTVRNFLSVHDMHMSRVSTRLRPQKHAYAAIGQIKATAAKVFRADA